MREAQVGKVLLLTRAFRAESSSKKLFPRKTVLFSKAPNPPHLLQPEGGGAEDAGGGYDY